MKEREVQTFGNYILASLHMSGEYNKSKGLTKKVLLVEGKTDVAFIKATPHKRQQVDIEHQSMV